MGNTIGPAGPGQIPDIPEDLNTSDVAETPAPTPEQPEQAQEPHLQSALGELGLDGQLRESEIRGMLDTDMEGAPIPLFSGGVVVAQGDTGGPSASMRVALLPQQLDAAKIPPKLRDEFMAQASKKSSADLNHFLDMADAAIKSSNPAAAVKSLVMQGRIDAYFESFNQTYEINGKQVKALPHFRMADGFSGPSGTTGNTVKSVKIQDDLNLFLAKHDKAHYNDAMKAAIHGVAYGRATAGQIKMVTDALIRSGEFTKAQQNHPGLSDSDTIRMMQWDHGVGIDCAGYVQQAFLNIQGGDRGHFGFRDFGGEDLMHLKGKPNLTQVKVEDVQPGDLMALDPPPPGKVGHTVLVRDTHIMSAAELKSAHIDKDWAGPNDKVHMITVDGSFGAHSTGNLEGGLTHRTWLYNETTKKWAEWKQTPTGGTEFAESMESGPYDHLMNGIYRAK